MARTILQKIVATKRLDVRRARAERPLAEIHAAIDRAPIPRDLYAAVTKRGSDIGLIAEIKKASPSAGLIRDAFDPAAIARTYQGCGASALSVLTDTSYFQGDLGHLSLVKTAVNLPVLRKDFIIDEYQVFESRAAGADAILLIASILTIDQIRAWARLAVGLNMATLVEIHDRAELDRVLDVAASSNRVLIGINNRDLAAQRTDLETTIRLAAGIGHDVPFVAESGIKTRQDVLRMREAGASAVLVGETFMRADDIGAKVRELFPAGRRGG